MVQSRINFKLDPTKVARARKIAPTSEFADRNITDETPIITDKTLSCIAKQLIHSEYLQRVDAVEKIGELAEKGVNVEKLIPALESASEDYSPYVKDAAKKAFDKIEEAKKSSRIVGVKDIGDTDPLITFNGRILSLPEAMKENTATRNLALQKIIKIALIGADKINEHAKIAIVGQIKEIMDDKNLISGLDRHVKSNIRKIIQ